MVTAKLFTNVRVFTIYKVNLEISHGKWFTIAWLFVHYLAVPYYLKNYVLQYKAIPWAKSKAQLAIKKECTSLVSRLGSLGKVQILWEGHKIWKNLPPVLTKQLFLLSSVKTSGRFFFKFLWPFQKNWTVFMVKLLDVNEIKMHNIFLD